MSDRTTDHRHPDDVARQHDAMLECRSRWLRQRVDHHLLNTLLGLYLDNIKLQGLVERLEREEAMR